MKLLQALNQRKASNSIRGNCELFVSILRQASQSQSVRQGRSDLKVSVLSELF